MDQSSRILCQYKLSQTATRKAILELLLQTDSAMSEKEIQENIPCNCDRSTVYRSLNTFLEKGIIHEVAIDGVLRFVLHTKTMEESHAHFKCEACGDVTCIEQIGIKSLALPNGFKPHGHQVLITGICSTCNASEGIEV